MVVRANSSVQYVPTGHILYWREGSVIVHAFDPSRLEVTSRQLALILVDLEDDELVWSKVLEGLGQRGTGEAKVVAFGPHENVALLERAKALGCDLALSRGEFNRDLLKILLGLGKDSN